MIKRIKYGREYLGLVCDKKILESAIENYINKTEGSFSFKELYNHIKNIAEENNYFDKEPNTEYSQIELQNDDVQIINMVLWKKIWNKELIIDFHKDLYYRTYPDEFHFIKVNI